jgi:hypothetical protein
MTLTMRPCASRLRERPSTRPSRQTGLHPARVGAQKRRKNRVGRDDAATIHEPVLDDGVHGSHHRRALEIQPRLLQRRQCRVVGGARRLELRPAQHQFGVILVDDVRHQFVLATRDPLLALFQLERLLGPCEVALPLAHRELVLAGVDPEQHLSLGEAATGDQKWAHIGHLPADLSL